MAPKKPVTPSPELMKAFGTLLKPEPCVRGERKSVGHIMFVETWEGTFEFYTRDDGDHDADIYKAPIHNVFNPEGQRHGRWEGADRPSLRQVLGLPLKEK